MITLMPRLSGAAAQQMLDEMLADDGFRWPGFSADTLPNGARFAATGGSVIHATRLRELRKELVALAGDFGFGAEDRKNRFGEYDTALTRWIAGLTDFSSGEALRDDVWCFIAVAMAPDIVHWRFGTSTERYLGGVRNCFQRAWLRARALDRGESHSDRWGLVDQLTEDALVQITERPSIGADPVLSLALAEGWVRAASRIGRPRMEAVMRQATLRLRVRNEVQALTLLDEDDLADIVDQLFNAASEQKIAISPAVDIPANPDVGESGVANGASAPLRKKGRSLWRTRSSG
ncbi:hypothetical protein R1538_25120 [Rhizobium leguminosarum]|uniref:hypothetical protein n=1 Tax=Rhizobium leguminosarum TaxID=384 RepID=UPI00293DB279|nr:hypothetical protein [Rhizobium leguminosarum]MDV4164397.1 hypothetical protein [Rhizobium leguminosarum]MDV4174683.1 hypothetical protein [Rhizobium leguminosarum]